MVFNNSGNGTSIKNNDLFEFLMKHPPIKPMSTKSKEMLFNHVLELREVSGLSISSTESLKSAIHNFSITILRYWQKCTRSSNRFRNNNKQWLDLTIITSGTSRSDCTPLPSSSFGRPKKNFSDLTEKNKRRRLNVEVHSRSKEELSLAASMKLQSEGHQRAASLILDISSSPENAQSLQKSVIQQEDISYSPQEALSLFTELKLTKHQYVALRASTVTKNLKNLFPPYYKLLEEKTKCYPPNIQVTETSAEVSLQNLVDHTSTRILHHQSEVLNNEDSLLEFFYKWGADGSGSHKNYKQNFEAPGSDDSYLFMSTLVPIRVNSVNNREKIYWQNPRTNSVRFCRPFRMRFIKETDEIIKDEFTYIENQIRNLLPTTVQINGHTFTARHSLLKTMVDGKVCNSLSANTSTQRCYICKASSFQLNNIEESQSRNYDAENFNFGISPLHAYIRFYEFLLHVSYKLPIKNKQARGEENKKIVAERKKHIQTEFKEKLGLLVDMPKVGFGNTNDGNSARKFFSDPETTSNIIGIDNILIERFSIILRTLNSPYKINTANFAEYAKQTAQRYVELYSWYPMTPTVHKVLVHGQAIIEIFLLPIGMLGEDAQESRHKDVRYYREHNTRKISRQQTNEDLIKILFISSDPVISNMRALPNKQKNAFPTEMLNLLQEPELVIGEE